MDNKTYRGNCHCGMVVFEVQLPHITKLPVCNCSICYKTGTLWALTTNSNIRWVQGDPQDLKSYQFAVGTCHYKFCPECGTPVVSNHGILDQKDRQKEHDEVSLNIRCFQHGLIKDPWDMEIELFDRLNLDEPYKAPTYTGRLPQPRDQKGNMRLYTGSCHCGAVQVALLSKSIDATFTDPIYECNCSGCIRAAGYCAYPHKDSIVIHGEENTEGYSYGRLRAWEKYWCKHCGVFIGRRPLDLPDEVVANLPEMAKKWTVDIHHLRPINLRIMNDVDLEQVKTTRINGYGNIPPMYKNP